MSPIPRHEWPGRIVLMIGCARSLSAVYRLVSSMIGRQTFTVLAAEAGVNVSAGGP